MCQSTACRIHSVGNFVDVYTINTKLVYELVHIFGFFQVLSRSSEEFSKIIVRVSLEAKHFK